MFAASHFPAALNLLDPIRALVHIVEDITQHTIDGFAQITKPGSEALKKINEEVHRKAEEGRLDR